MSGSTPNFRHHPMLAAASRLAWRLADGPTRWLWRRFSPVTLGARAIIRDTEGHVLLVRRSIDQCWYLPGGGVHRGEVLLDAVAREVREETGLAVSPESAGIFGVYSSFLEGKSDHSVVLTCIATGDVQPDGIEIDAAAFWPPAASPDTVSPGTRRRLGEFVSGTTTPVTATW